MNTGLGILDFELKRRFSRASTVVYAIVFFMLGFALVTGASGVLPGVSVSFSGGGKTHFNSPIAVCMFVAIAAQFATVTLAAFSGRATYDDVEANITELLYTTPISTRSYLLGRYIGALSMSAFVTFMIPIGACAAMYMPWVDRAQLGPFVLSSYVRPLILIVWPNVVFCTCLFFSLAALTRRMLPVYVGGIVLLIGYLVAMSFGRDIEHRDLAAFLDPFGFRAMARATEYWTIAEKNKSPVPLTPLLFGNRVLYVAIGLVALVATVMKFERRHHAIGARTSPEAKTPAVADAHAEPPKPRTPVHIQPSPVRAFASLLRLQFVETVKNRLFFVVALAGVAFMLSTSGQVGKLYGTRTLPVTYAVLDIFHGTFAAFILAIVTIFSGELLWRERDARLAQIYDALPISSGVVFASKFIALIGCLCLLLGTLTICGIGLQLARGFTRIELWHYAVELFGIQLVSYAMIAALAFFFHSAFNAKYYAHVLMMAFYATSIALPLAGFRHYLYRFGDAPSPTYSDMNGYGHFVRAVVWFDVYWGLLSVALLVAASSLLARGLDTSWHDRVRRGYREASQGICVVMITSLFGFVLTGCLIFRETNIARTYRPKEVVEKQAASYERDYAAYKGTPTLTVTEVAVHADLFPTNRRAFFQSHIHVKNATAVAIERVFVDLPQRPRRVEWKLDSGERIEVDDRARGVQVIAFAKPIAAGEERTLSVSLDYDDDHLHADEPNNDLAENGTFLNSDYLPSFGYQESRELRDDDDRKKSRLKPKPRMRDLHDAAGRDCNYIGCSAGFIRFSATVSTEADQIAIAPGYLTKEWTENGRRFFRYEMPAPMLNFYSFLSARYAVRRDKWRDVDIEINYHPRHDRNLDRMIASAKETLEYATAKFSPYQHKLVRIVEFPRYQTFAQAFPNTIPYSEAVGFIADIHDENGTDEDDIDFPFYVTAHEVGHQWWAHQVIGANVQGATVMSESLAQFTSLMVMKHHYGEKTMRKFLRYELDQYLRGRSSERKKELPLMRNENQPYIFYQKGSLAFYALQDALGEDTITLSLQAYLGDHAFKGPPYTTSEDFLAYIRARTAPVSQPLIDDWFGAITLYDVRAESATAKKRPDGKYEITIKGRVRKMHADELGAEQDVPFSETVGVGALDDKGHVVFVDNRRLLSGEVTTSFVLDALPAKAGLDPLHMLVDRKPDDNTVVVRLE